MFVLQKAFRKPKRLSDTAEPPPVAETLRQAVNFSPPRSTVFDPTRSMRADALPARTTSDPSFSSPVPDSSLAEDNHEIDSNNPPPFPTALSMELATNLDAADRIGSVNILGLDHFSQPPSPTVIEEHPMDGALMSGQSDVVHSMLSACNDLPPLPDALAPLHHPRYMPTDPSPFTSPIASHFHYRPPRDTLRLGGPLKILVDGQEFIGRVTEIYVANRTRSPPGYPTTTRKRPYVQRAPSYRAWCADDQEPPVQRWVNGLAATYQLDEEVTTGQDSRLSGTATKLDAALLVGTGNNGPAPLTSDPEQPLGVDALVQSRNQSPQVNTIPVTAYMGASGVDIRNKEGLPTDRDTRLLEALRVPHWQYAPIISDKTYQCGGVLGQGSFGKVVHYRLLSRILAQSSL
jgi:hypothetical protein